MLFFWWFNLDLPQHSFFLLFVLGQRSLATLAHGYFPRTRFNNKSTSYCIVLGDSGRNLQEICHNDMERSSKSRQKLNGSRLPVEV